MVVRRLAGALDARVAAQVKVELERVADVAVDDCAGRDVARAVRRRVAARQQPRVVPLLHDDERHRRVVRRLQAGARGLDGHELVAEHLVKLPLADAVAVKQDGLGLDLTVGRIILQQQIAHRRLQVHDDLCASGLQQHAAGKAAGALVDAADDGGDGALAGVAPRGRHRVRHVGAHDEEAAHAAEHRQPARRLRGVLQHARVDAVELRVDLQREVGGVLRAVLAEVARPYARLLRDKALAGHTEHRVRIHLDILIQCRVPVRH
mmetsp:Transcript_42155/g.126198  ORF Transcript_42155/g.126198 Transcript_42155/m.126198 type:complete len:264 (-) Transcript_42155:1832-2623(-)